MEILKNHLDYPLSQQVLAELQFWSKKNRQIERIYEKTLSNFVPFLLFEKKNANLSRQIKVRYSVAMHNLCIFTIFSTKYFFVFFLLIKV